MSLTLHRAVFWAHLAAGLLAGLVILSLAVSGLLIAYEVQLTEWANRSLRVAPPAAGAAPLDAAELVAKVREIRPDLQPSGLTWKADPGAPVTLSVSREGVFFADPYRGTFLDEGNRAWRDFFHAATDWHRFLTGTGLPREVGKAITGAGTLVFFGLLLSGLYLWWPRHWRWANLRAALLLNSRLRGRARDWNWHNVIGFWTALPTLTIVLTGLIMAYGWANTLLFRATGNEPPPPRVRAAGGPGPNGERRPGPPVDFAPLVPLLAQVRQQVPDWRSLSLRLPQKPGDPFPVMVDRGGRGQPHLRRMFNLDTARQQVLTSADDFSAQNRGRQLRMLARYLHTGELFGFWGQTLAALCTLAAILLVWTGFALAWRRFVPKRRPAA